MTSAEPAAPEPAERYRDHGYWPTRDDLFYARPKACDLAVMGYSAFRKYAYDVAGRELCVHLFKRVVHDLFVFLRACNGNRFHRLKNELQQRHLEDLVPHDKPYRSSHRSCQDNGGQYS